MTIQVKTFDNMISCNAWLNSINYDDVKILKYYSNGPDYFFIVFEIYDQ